MNKRLIASIFILLLVGGGLFWYGSKQNSLESLSIDWISARYGDQPLQLSRLRPEGIIAVGVEERLNRFPFINEELKQEVDAYVQETQTLLGTKDDSLSQDFLSRINFEQQRVEIILKNPEAFLWSESFSPMKALPRSLYYHHPIRAREEAVKYINRLSKVGTYVSEFTSYLTVLTENGYQPHPWVIDHEIELIDSLLCEDFRENIFYAGFQRKVNQVDYVYVNENDILGYLERIVQLLDEDIYPAFLRLKSTLQALKEKEEKFSSMGGEGFSDLLYYYTSRKLEDTEGMGVFLDSIKHAPEELTVSIEKGRDEASTLAPFDLLEERIREIRLEEGKSDLYTSGLFEEEFSFYTRISLLPGYLAFAGGAVQFEYGALDTARKSLLYVHPDYSSDESISPTQIAYRFLSRGEQTAWLYPYYQDSSLTQAARAFMYPAFTEGWGWYMYEIVNSQLDLFAGNQTEKNVFHQAVFRECLKWEIEHALHVQGISPEKLLEDLSENTHLNDPELKKWITLSLEQPGRISSGLIGWFSWNQLREAGRKEKGRAFVLQEFHHQMFAQGMLPFQRLLIKIRQEE